MKAITQILPSINQALLAENPKEFAENSSKKWLRAGMEAYGGFVDDSRYFKSFTPAHKEILKLFGNVTLTYLLDASARKALRVSDAQKQRIKEVKVESTQTFGEALVVIGIFIGIRSPVVGGVGIFLGVMTYRNANK